MAKILEKKLPRTPDVFYYRLASPLISKKAQPGQFVVIRLHETGYSHRQKSCRRERTFGADVRL